MNPESYRNGMNGLVDLWHSGGRAGHRRIKMPAATAPWDGDWRLAIAEERVATAQAKLAAAEQRVRELTASTNR